MFVHLLDSPFSFIYINTMIIRCSSSIPHVSNLVCISVRFVLGLFNIPFFLDCGVFLDCEALSKSCCFFLFLFLALCSFSNWTLIVLKMCCTFILSISCSLTRYFFHLSFCQNVSMFVVIMWINSSQLHDYYV